MNHLWPNLTQSQITAAHERRARLGKIAARARPDTPIECLSASVRSGKGTSRPRAILAPLEPETVRSWVDRQLGQHPENWFWGEQGMSSGAPLVEDIIAKVCAFYLVQRADLLSPSREARFVRPRQIAMYLAKKLTSRSLPDIGRRLGGRDHTTVLHAVRKIGALRESDATMAAELDELEQRLMRPANAGALTNIASE
jgi:hypothetical protein